MKPSMLFSLLFLLGCSSFAWAFTVMHSSGHSPARALVLRADKSSSSSSSSSSEEVDTAATTETKPPVRCPDCDLCDGSGRIAGGIGAVLDWWPIKAYRPCPNFIERGGQYQRSGQGLDEIAFGRDTSFRGGDN